jgi:hypothetical protein
MQIDQNAASTTRRRGRPVTAMATALLTFGFVLVVLLRHDFWNWSTARPLLLGVLPVGLWWQALVSIAASALMWACVTFAWPEHLEEQ